MGDEKPEIGKTNENIRHQREKPRKLPIDNEAVVTVSVEEPPPGSISNGHVSFDVQGVIFKATPSEEKAEQIRADFRSLIQTDMRAYEKF